MVSTKNTVNARVEGLRSGADDFLGKPTIQRRVARVEVSPTRAQVERPEESLGPDRRGARLGLLHRDAPGCSWWLRTPDQGFREPRAGVFAGRAAQRSARVPEGAPRRGGRGHRGRFRRARAARCRRPRSEGHPFGPTTPCAVICQHALPARWRPRNGSPGGATSPGPGAVSTERERGGLVFPQQGHAVGRRCLRARHARAAVRRVAGGGHIRSYQHQATSTCPRRDEPTVCPPRLVVGPVRSVVVYPRTESQEATRRAVELAIDSCPGRPGGCPRAHAP